MVLERFGWKQMTKVIKQTKNVVLSPDWTKVKSVTHPGVYVLYRKQNTGPAYSRGSSGGSSGTKSSSRVELLSSLQSESE